jgi:hypothetical protein
MMEAVRTSETSVDNYFTRQYIPEDNSELQTKKQTVIACKCICDIWIITDTYISRSIAQRKSLQLTIVSFNSIITTFILLSTFIISFWNNYKSDSFLQNESYC